MNIADLVTQVHGGEEEEDEELQQDATLGESAAQRHTADRQTGSTNGRRKRIRRQPIRLHDHHRWPALHCDARRYDGLLTAVDEWVSCCSVAPPPPRAAVANVSHRSQPPAAGQSAPSRLAACAALESHGEGGALLTACVCGVHCTDVYVCANRSRTALR